MEKHMKIVEIKVDSRANYCYYKSINFWNNKYHLNNAFETQVTVEEVTKSGKMKGEDTYEAEK